MEQNRFGVVPHALTRLLSRRTALRGLAAAGLGWGLGRLSDVAEAKKKRKKKKRRKNQDPNRPLCASNGEACSDRGPGCQERFCLRDSFTVEAIWSRSGADHQTLLYVPPEFETASRIPFIAWNCNPTNSTCAVEYPFACVDRDAEGPGDEVTTVYERLPGNYSYAIGLVALAPAGELTVVLTDRVGRVVRAWANPANTSTGGVVWHVFDVDADGRVASVDVSPSSKNGANVCPFLALGRREHDRTVPRATRRRPKPAADSAPTGATGRRRDGEP